MGQRAAPIFLALLVASGPLTGCEEGCDRGPSSEPPSEPPRPPRPMRRGDASVAELLGLDAEATPDPPPPAGDLKAEVEAFTTLEACVASRTAFDPVVGDAIDAIGYDTLRHDACRVLQAVKTRDPSACNPIAASSLREHCEASVAIVAADEGLCPMALEGHDPLCVALARRDSRLCTVVPRDDRAMCRAVLAHDPTRCERSPRCERLLARWSSLISDSAQGPELGTRIVMTVTGSADAGDRKPKTFDLSKEVGPATVRKGAAGTNILIGDSTSVAWPPAMIAPDPRLSMVLSVSPSTIKQGKHTVDAHDAAFVVLAPKVATVSSEAMEEPVVLNVDLVGLDIGSPVRFTLEAHLPEDRGGYRIHLEVNTFVRDVVTTGP